MTQIATIQNKSLALVPSSMDEAMRVADFMSQADMLPDHFKRKAGNCLMVVIQAQTWNMNPIAVAQCTSIVRGRLCYEGKLVSAVLMSMGAISEELDYKFSGSGSTRKVVVTGKLANGNVREVDGTVAQWKTNNEQWSKDADQMLTYRGARQWARRWAPAAMLGVYTPDEAAEMQPVSEGSVTQLDASGKPESGHASMPLSKSEKAAAQAENEAQPGSSDDNVVEGDFTPRDEPKATTAVEWTLGDNQRRLVLKKAENKGISEAELQAKFPALSNENINDVLSYITQAQAA